MDWISGNPTNPRNDDSHKNEDYEKTIYEIKDDQTVVKGTIIKGKDGSYRYSGTFKVGDKYKKDNELTDEDKKALQADFEDERAKIRAMWPGDLALVTPDSSPNGYVGCLADLASMETMLEQPADRSALGGLAVRLAWVNPPGTTQYHVQVLPENEDGPAINLIIGDAALVASQGFTIQAPQLGGGNYVILPGASYVWRVRTTRNPLSADVNDPGWGPWSDIRIFSTPRPSASTITLRPTEQFTAPAAPALQWADSNPSTFYYEVEVSGDPTFNTDPATATSFVYWNLIHGGQSDPLNSYRVPSSAALGPGTYYWRVRPRVQATHLGTGEPGVQWGPATSFVVVPGEPIRQTEQYTISQTAGGSLFITCKDGSTTQLSGVELISDAVNGNEIEVVTRTQNGSVFKDFFHRSCRLIRTEQLS